MDTKSAGVAARWPHSRVRLALAGVLLLAIVLVQLGAERVARSSPRPIDGYIGDAERGAYVVKLAGCVACHTDENGGAALAGGRRLETPFGTFVTPNITPSAKTGIAGWTLSEFYVALTRGISPDGDHYYPAFPYTSYSRMKRQDIADLKAYLDSVEPATNAVADHDLSFPFNLRPALALWKLIYLQRGECADGVASNQAVTRGAYIVNGPGHCAECHTPRNMLGGLVEPALGGNDAGPDGEAVPPLRGPGALDGWTAEDLVFALEVGMLPDGDSIGGSMGTVIEEGTSHLTAKDLEAVAAYLLARPR